MRIIVFGATGAVGKHVVARLKQDTRIEHVLIVARKQAKDQGKISYQTIADFLVNPMSSDTRYDAAICCLGTTLKQAGSKSNFTAIELNLTLRLLSQAKACGASTIVYNSSLGALATSRSFYLRTKAQVEHAITDLQFNHTVIVRPSLLKGTDRTPFRLGEWLAVQLDKLLFWCIPKRYRAIDVQVVAQAITAQLHQPLATYTVLESEQLTHQAV
ncbi:hypothetical protein PALB_13230 [Pseudoalteromonas luteoviolacea B = ATCC 29581]|nr:hypothetical protein PALB_13230 [Pseudoalteromonas luteoviolacea B = ATCC 29581]